MKKITIITLNDPMPNIGNCLQNYAVQEIIKKLDYEVKTLSFQPSMLTLKFRLKYVLQKITGFKLGGDRTFWEMVPPRLMKFERFRKKYINTEYIEKIKDIEPTDYYIVGSDQVWNPAWHNDYPIRKELFLLTFEKDSNKKISLSASFGISTLPEEWKDFYKEHLSKFRAISVREDSGAVIINDLFEGEKTAEVLIDPTLMMGKDDWNKIAVKPQKMTSVSRKYILTYFLGKSGKNKYVQDEIRRYETELGYAVINILDMNDKDFYSVDPSEFIWLISHAELILTNSFHACAFSIIYERPFIVYDRNEDGMQSMGSRIETLLEKFSLQRKYFKNQDHNKLLESDYHKALVEFLPLEQDKMLRYLKSSLKD